jgi:AcrR family transcriptional regulator
LQGVSANEFRPRAARPARKPRSDGERSRTTILREAARLATIEGIGGLSIGRLADAVGMSKSGLFAHFGSKEELQLATIDLAGDLFTEHVLSAGDDARSARERLSALTEGYLRYVGEETFPGGCFFASVLSEVDMRPGPVRDAMFDTLRGWLGLLESTIREAQADGTIAEREEPAQLAFELEALLYFSNQQYVVQRSQEPIERARRAIRARLAVAERA